MFEFLNTCTNTPIRSHIISPFKSVDWLKSEQVHGKNFSIATDLMDFKHEHLLANNGIGYEEEGE